MDINVMTAMDTGEPKPESFGACDSFGKADIFGTGQQVFGVIAAFFALPWVYFFGSNSSLERRFLPLELLAFSV